MGGICCGHLVDLKVDKGCKIQRMPTNHGDCHKRLLVRVAHLDVPGAFQPSFHYDCAENQLRGVVERVMGPVPKPTDEGISCMMKACHRWGRTLGSIPPDDVREMPNRYIGAKRKRYEAALEKLLVGGLNKSDSYCTAFVKAERINGQEKVNPPPRMIQFRGAKFGVAISQYLHPIEQSLYLTSVASAGVPKTRNIAKGLNSVERAELLATKLKGFVRPVILSLDCSKFDKHVAKRALQVEHALYLYANPDPEFAKLLSWQLVNKVFTKLGFVYKVDGRRMSGDMNTAIGNCVLMLIMLMAYAISNSLKVWDCLDDGDDCLLIIEEEDLDRVLGSITGSFLSFGHVLKVEKPARSLFEVTFCQSSIIEFQTGRYKFVRDWRKVVSKALCGVRHWETHAYRRRVLKAIGTCELVLNVGVPVLQAFSLAILRNCGNESVDLKYAPDGLRARYIRDKRLVGDLGPQPVQLCARQSFEEAFGLVAEDQIRLEKYLDSWVFTDEEITLWGPEWDVRAWLPLYSCVEIYAPLA